jgi:hypothetical protein
MRGIAPYSIRLAARTRRNLDAIQRELSARSGQKVALSDVIDQLLSGPVPRRDLLTEIEELRSDPQGTISKINEKQMARLPYRRSELLYIVEQILEDAEGLPSHQSIFDPVLWSGVYDALISIAGLFPTDSPVLRYIASTALSEPTRAGGDFDAAAVQTSLAGEKATFLSRPSPAKNSYVVRALHVAIRDGGIATDDTSKVTDDEIERALSGSKRQLTKLAIRAVVDRTGKPLLRPNFSGVPDAFNFSTKLVSMGATLDQSGDIVCGVILGNDDLCLQLSLNGFGQLSDLQDCLVTCRTSEIRKTRRFEVRAPHSKGGDTYLIIDGVAPIRMGANCVTQLSAGLTKLLTFDDWSAQLAQLRDAYGR